MRTFLNLVLNFHNYVIDSVNNLLKKLKFEKNIDLWNCCCQVHHNIKTKSYENGNENKKLVFWININDNRFY